jgi:membrane-bound lytic murein transglycosylase D
MRRLGPLVAASILLALPHSLVAQADLNATAEAQVASWIARFRGQRREDLQRGLANAEWWRPLVQTKLARAGLPAMLDALPLLESNYNPLATPHGRAGAVGLWQFVPATARAYGLRVEAGLDERLDPWRATDAAVHYLADLIREHRGNWPLALASFNAGTGRVMAAATASTSRAAAASDDPSVYWVAQARMPRETQAYLPALVALTRIIAHPVAYGIVIGEVQPPPSLVRIAVAPGTTLRSVADRFHVSLADVMRWNPAILGDRTPGRGYDLVIPVSALAERGGAAR